MKGSILSNAKKWKGSFLQSFLAYSITDLFSSAAFEDWNAYFPFADVMFWEELSLFSTNCSSSCKSSLEIHHHPGVSKTIDKSVI